MHKLLVPLSSLFKILLLVFDLTESETIRHIYFSEASPNRPSCQRPSFRAEQVFTTDTKNSTLALIGGHVIFTPVLNHEGCAYIKANINPFSLGYNTYSEQEDGLYQCYLFCTRSFQYTYIGMHQRKCSCLVQTDIRDYNVCKTADIISCGFLNSTLCSTKENIVVLYKIKYESSPGPVTCKKDQIIFQGTGNSLKRRSSDQSLDTRGVRILTSGEVLHSKQHCCIAAFVRSNNPLMNPTVYTCNAALPQACVSLGKGFKWLYFVLLTLVICGVHIPVFGALIYHCVKKQKCEGMTPGNISEIESVPELSCSSQINDTEIKAIQTMYGSNVASSSTLNDLSFLLTEVFRRLNGDFKKCAINISFFGEGAEDEDTIDNRRNRLSVTFDNTSKRMQRERPYHNLLSLKERKDENLRSYTAMHTYGNEIEFSGNSFNCHSGVVHKNENELLSEAKYEHFTNVSYCPRKEDRLRNHCVYLNSKKYMEDVEYVDGYSPSS